MQINTNFIKYKFPVQNESYSPMNDQNEQQVKKCKNAINIVSDIVNFFFLFFEFEWC